MSARLDVLIVGAGPAGLALACDLVQTDVSFRIVSAEPGGFPGSRAKGIQPRTQEVLDSLGVLPALAKHAARYPKLGVHLGPIVIPKTMIALHEPTDAVPHADTLLVAQHDTDESLRGRLTDLGGNVDFSTRLTTLRQESDHVMATLEGPNGIEEVESTYLVGADGGGSAVRTVLGIAFDGTTDEDDRMIIADLDLTGLSRSRWHVWPRPRGKFMALCPMPSGETSFQLMLKIKPGADPELGRDGLLAAMREFPGTGKIAIERVRWTSVWRPNIRLAQQYRQGRVLLVGDAAHVHPPTGAQGLNTGIQDAYNLGWKLVQVLAGAPDALLDTYEAERQPVAARVLGLSSELYASMRGRPDVAMTRGDEERQLSLTYRGGPLAEGIAPEAPGLQPGDRLPGFRWTGPSGSAHIFERMRGQHFTLISLGHEAREGLAAVTWPTDGAPLVTVDVPDTEADRIAAAILVDLPAHVLVRPDGYVAAISHGSWAAGTAKVLAEVLP